ncbi:hypothetical protein NBRC110019_19160 [Neptunitalea chrysea]|uniref:Uncharacterized protein n=1 Tax=Neptunitalea chrysea TaxID=1647581 RepID=A0A9W6B503_9FLAO|nr:hypothetical protein [Neptunitalea chrysea]GLB52876.1 hypothetical protein NBRC110019_19160 [Neptunitalea chrysea]
MNKKLTTEQIEDIYLFVTKHVEFYDVQMELVDHMANGIEEQWKENEHVSFEIAFNEEFKKFGVSGFENIQEEKYLFLKKRYHTMIWKEMVGFFKLPQVIATVLMVYLIYLLLGLMEIGTLSLFYTYLVPVVLLFIIAYTLYQYRKYRRSKAKLVFQKILYKDYVAIPLVLFNSLFWRSVSTFEKVGYMSEYMRWITAFLMVVFGLYLFVTFIMIPINASKYLDEMHPGYKQLGKI